MPKFAANLTWMFHEYEFPDRFAAAQKLGFEAMECQFPYKWGSGELGYSGWIGCEFKCGEPTANGLGWKMTRPACMKYFRP